MAASENSFEPLRLLVHDTSIEGNPSGKLVMRQELVREPLVENSAPKKNCSSSLHEIDFLRGISAFGVVLFHSRVNLWVGVREIHSNPDAYSDLDRTLAWMSLPVSQLGYMVMLFFVISGFCIHLPQAASSTAIGVRSYTVRRFYRIYPPYVAILALCFALELILRLAGQSRESGSGIFLASLALIQNYTFHGGQVPSNPSLWSIPVEVELYIAYPIFMSFLRRRGWGMGAGLLVTGIFSAAAAAIYAAGWSWPDTNFLKFWVLWWSGAWLAERWAAAKLPAWGGIAWGGCVLVMVLLMAGMVWKWDHAYMHFVWGAVSFLVLWRSLCQRRGSIRAPRFLVWLGDVGVKMGIISYSLYLVHFPVLHVVGLLWHHWIGTNPSSFLIPMAASLLCIPIAWAFYRLIERPSHRLGKLLSRSLGGSAEQSD